MAKRHRNRKFESKRIQTLENKGYSYTGASVDKRALKGFTGSSGSPNEDINYNNNRLRQRSRLLCMSGGIALSAINTNRTNVIGTGLFPESRIDREFLGMTLEEADAWQKNTEREFSLWANDKRACDATGMNDFYSMQQLAFVSWLTSGDSFGVVKRYARTIMNPYSLRLHIVEADRVCTPNASLTRTDGKNGDNAIYDGVEILDAGLVEAYHICNVYPNEISGKRKEWTRVLAYGEETGLPNILHVMNSDRPDQYRGIPLLAPVIEYVMQIRRYTEAELMAAIVESFFTAFVTTQSDADEMPFNEPIAKDQSSVSDDENEYEMGPGTVNILNPGEDVKFGAPTRPAGGFNEFVRAIAVLIGAALEIPADLLLKEFGKSYSASRAALLEAWKAFKMRRRWFVSDFCAPVYEIWMYEAVALGRIKAPGFSDDPLIRQAYLGATWIGPSQGMLDPTKEISAEIMACAHGLSTHSDSATRLNGSDWDANVERLAVEIPKLEAAVGQNEFSTTLVKTKILKDLEDNNAGNSSTNSENKD